MKKFVIVGGGTAGWMTALVLANQWQQAVEVTLIESADVGIIGVGEGSTPALAMFFKTMKIDESKWMHECIAAPRISILLSYLVLVFTHDGFRLCFTC